MQVGDDRAVRHSAAQGLGLVAQKGGRPDGQSGVLGSQCSLLGLSHLPQVPTSQRTFLPQQFG